MGILSRLFWSAVGVAIALIVLYFLTALVKRYAGGTVLGTAASTVETLTQPH